MGIEAFLLRHAQAVHGVFDLMRLRFLLEWPWPRVKRLRFLSDVTAFLSRIEGVSSLDHEMHHGSFDLVAALLV